MTAGLSRGTPYYGARSRSDAGFLGQYQRSVGGAKQEVEFRGRHFPQRWLIPSSFFSHLI